jgi:hypothetical protein
VAGAGGDGNPETRSRDPDAAGWGHAGVRASERRGCEARGTPSCTHCAHASAARAVRGKPRSTAISNACRAPRRVRGDGAPSRGERLAGAESLGAIIWLEHSWGSFRAQRSKRGLAGRRGHRAEHSGRIELAGHLVSDERGGARRHALRQRAQQHRDLARTRPCKPSARDETCPVSTEGWTRRVHFVREGGGGRGATHAARPPAPPPPLHSAPCCPLPRASSLKPKR